MTKQSISLALSLLLSLSPLAVAGPQASARPAEKSSVGAAAPAASGPSSLISRVQTGSPAGLRSLAHETGAEAAFIRAAAADATLLSDPAIRAQAVEALGEEAVAQLAAASAALRRDDPRTAAALSELRSTPADARAALTRIISEADAWKAPDAGTVAGFKSSTFKQTLRKPSRLKSAVAGLALLMGMGTAVVPALSQPLLPSPAVLTSQMPQGQLIRVRADMRGVVQVADVQQMLAQFDPAAQIYLVSNPTISDSELARIAASLKGKPWVAVIVGDTQISGNVYRNNEGRTFRGFEAVEWAVNEGLYNKGGVTDHNNPQTGDRDGGIITFMQRTTQKDDGTYVRKVNVRGSDALHAFGLVVEKSKAKAGDRVWPGDLDRPLFINILLSGNNLVGAIDNTVSTLDRMLAEKIQASQDLGKTAIASAKTAVDQLVKAQADFARRHSQAAATIGAVDASALQRAVASAERFMQQAKGRDAANAVAGVADKANAALQQMASFDRAFDAIASRVADANASVAALDKAAAAYRAEHKKATGDLASPKIADMKDAIAAAETLRQTNPQAAGSKLDGVIAQARAATEAILQTKGGAERIAAADTLRKEQAAKPYASAASEELLQAEQALRAADENLRNGSSQWLAKLNEGRALVDQAETKITAAAAQAAADATRNLLLSLLLGFLTLGIGLFFNRRVAAPARRKALEELKPWDAKFAVQDDAVIDNMDKWLLDNSDRGWQGKTKAVIDAMRQEAGAAHLRSTKVKQVYAQIRGLVHPSLLRIDRWLPNLVASFNYSKAARLLESDQIEVNLEERKRDWKENAYGPIDNFKPFKTTFKALFDDYRAHGLKAVQAKESVENARAATATIAKDIEEAVTKVTASKATIGNADGLFQAQNVFDKALPQAQSLVAETLKLKDFDPVGAMEAGGADAQRIAKDSQALIEAIAAARAGALAQAAASSAELVTAGIKADWITNETSSLSEQSDAIAKGLLKKPQGEEIKSLTDSLNALAAKAADAAAGAKKLAEQRARVTAGEQKIAEARQKASQAIGLPADKLLVEKDNNPTEALEHATDAGTRAEKLLAKGDLDKAKAAVTEMQSAIDTASEMVVTALKALETHAATVQALQTAGEALAGRVPQAQKVLESIRSEFAASVLKLTAGDASHPSANGTIDDNIDEANLALETAADKLKKAEAAFKGGQILKSDQILKQIAAHNEMADDRLKEVHEKRARLDASVAANAKLKGELTGYLTEVQGIADDQRTMAATIKEFAAVKAQLTKAFAAVDAKKGDPFQAADLLSTGSAALLHVRKSAKNDWDIFAHAENSLKAAYDHLDEAGKTSQKLQAEQGGQGPVLQRASKALEALGDAYEKAAKIFARDAKGGLKTPNGDWAAADSEADRINTETAKVIGMLKDAIKAAHAASDAISRAAGEVRDATTWTKRGRRVRGSPGSNELERARQALNNGDYDRAAQYAQAAAQAAAAAIAVLETEIRREIEAEEEAERERQRERRRREEAEERRRQREEDSNRGSGGSYGSGSSSSGSDWGSSSSGGDSSSIGSSSSGGDSSSF